MQQDAFRNVALNKSEDHRGPDKQAERIDRRRESKLVVIVGPERVWYRAEGLILGSEMQPPG
jgi:16S rRNA U1498 N3-methylase RsmE